MKRTLLGSAVASGLAVIGLGLWYRLAGRSWQLHWGAEEGEPEEPLPGDELLDHADLQATRAITIDAPPAQVWPWIAQIGQGRAGFYSYDNLENMIGGDIESAHAIVPEWQHIEVGDEIRLHPELALAVARVEPGYALVLRDAIEIGAADPLGNGGEEIPFSFTWAFVLRERDGRTRLLVRERYQYRHPFAMRFVEPVALASFIMTRKMLRGIRDRAEASAGTGTIA